MTLTVSAQNRLHLPLVKRAGVSRFFTRYHFQVKSFILSTWYSTDEDPLVRIMSFWEFQIYQITVCQINNHLK
jgi:hypothetical protein